MAVFSTVFIDRLGHVYAKDGGIAGERIEHRAVPVDVYDALVKARDNVLEEAENVCDALADSLQKQAWDARAELDFSGRDRLEAESDGAEKCRDAIRKLRQV